MYKIVKNAKTCYAIFDPGGYLIKEDQEILQVQENFYRRLYSKDPNVSFSMPNFPRTCVSEGLRLQQQNVFTQEEIAKAVLQMKNNKCPGIDGIPVDLYKVCWSRLVDCYYNMLLECYEKGELGQSALIGIINLLPKADKDVRYLKNL